MYCIRKDKDDVISPNMSQRIYHKLTAYTGVRLYEKPLYKED